MSQEQKLEPYMGTTDWFKIGKGVRQGYILSPCLFNFYAKYIMRNARLDDSEAGIKIARRNTNNLRYADDICIYHIGWLHSLVAQRVKHLPVRQETRVWSLGGEDPLEKKMATHSSILAWRIPWTEEAWWATVHGVAKSRTWLSDFTFTQMTPP